MKIYTQTEHIKLGEETNKVGDSIESATKNDLKVQKQYQTYKHE